MNFYITTPLYYVNDTPHIGHAYTTVVADVLTRYHKLFGTATRFLTGTDEHGQKVQMAAEKRGVAPQEHCDLLVQNFKAIWSELNIDYDIFFRTTDPLHKRAVQEALTQLSDAGEIYHDEYEGWYCVSEEIFYTEKDLVNGKSPNGNEVSKVREKNYFFRMSRFQKPLVEWIESHPEFIQPESKRNEVLGFLRKPLEDLCISRPKSRLSWGIELPFDKDYVTYVWFDALLNYANGVGFLQKDRAAEFHKWWYPPEGGALHLIGKDILNTHAVYWPTMLMALKIPLPRTIFAHGWWLTPDNEKMAKSRGTGISPLDVKNLVGVDALRYFLTRDIFLGNDAQFSVDLVVSRTNSELANNLGNLHSRTTNLLIKFFSGRMPEVVSVSERTQKLATLAQQVPALVRKDIERMAPNLALGHVVDLLNEANRYLEERAPWTAAKTDLPGAAESLRAASEVLRISAMLLSPVMPTKMKELLERIGWSAPFGFAETTQWNLLATGAEVKKGDPLFPRIGS